MGVLVPAPLRTKNEDGAWKPIPPDMVSYFRALPPETPFLFFRVVGGRPVSLANRHQSRKAGRGWVGNPTVRLTTWPAPSLNSIPLPGKGGQP